MPQFILSRRTFYVANLVIFDEMIRAAVSEYILKDQVQVDKDKYYHLGIGPEEIQISENEMASDSDRHRSLNRHRRVPYREKFSIAPQSIIEVREFLIHTKSIFSLAGLAVMI